ncbi:gamma-glutamyl-gamma-aminobutyrate hydrolase family protein [Listeria rocourtiae]|uniref:gamma-glutamyl-gamma-aminobutyrate hydrolase family protein n=1 Tax=Listeria rocourtiae TaxID=647910 RepID=UPI003D2F9A37
MTAIIGISAAQLTVQVPNTISRNGTYVGGDYVSVVADNGAAPLVIPITDTRLVKTFVDQLDGLILSGGQDISPKFYGAEAEAELGVTCEIRDAFELALLKETLAQKKPILAICRGAQLLNVALGGTLYQDTNSIEHANLPHMQQEQATQPTHPVKFEKLSRLHRIFGSSAQVNSFHHQAIETLGTGLKITAIAPDGIVEAIEKQGVPFVVGVQWHPELIANEDASMNRLFQEFVINAELGSLKQLYNLPSNLKKSVIAR